MVRRWRADPAKAAAVDGRTGEEFHPRIAYLIPLLNSRNFTDVSILIRPAEQTSTTNFLRLAAVVPPSLLADIRKSIFNLLSSLFLTTEEP